MCLVCLVNVVALRIIVLVHAECFLFSKTTAMIVEAFVMQLIRCGWSVTRTLREANPKDTIEAKFQLCCNSFVCTLGAIRYVIHQVWMVSNAHAPGGQS
jgi:hypothetical protein